MCIYGLTHSDPLTRRMVQKEGPNKGRQFFTCPKPRESQCGFFEWADDVPSSNIRPGLSNTCIILTLLCVPVYIVHVYYVCGFCLLMLAGVAGVCVYCVLIVGVLQLESCSYFAVGEHCICAIHV